MSQKYTVSFAKANSILNLASSNENKSEGMDLALFGGGLGVDRDAGNVEGLHFVHL